MRSPFGKAKVKLHMHQNNSDEEEAVDDDGDLDQYRIKPAEKDAKGKTGNIGSETSNGNNEESVNGMSESESNVEQDISTKESGKD